MNLFTLTGEVLLRGTDEVLSVIKQLTSNAESSSAKMRSSFEKLPSEPKGKERSRKKRSASTP